MMYSILLTAIFVLGAFLRFYNIEKCCLHGDGVLTAGIISDSKSLIDTWRNVTGGFHGDLPAYYIILDLWSYLVGDSVFCLRLFSLVCSLLFIAVVYKLAKLLFDRKTAILSAYLSAISPLLVFYSRKVRYYSLSSFLHLAGLYFFIRVIEKRDYRNCLFYVLLTAAGLYVNYSAFLFLLSQALFIILYRHSYPSGLKSWLKCLALVFILWLPISGYFFRDFILLLQSEGFVHAPFKAGWLISALHLFFSFFFGETVSPFNYPVVAAGAAVCSIVLAKFLKERFFYKTDRNVVFLIITILTVTFLCALSGYNFSRYIKAVSGLCAIAAALGILSFRKKTFVLVLIFVVTSLSAYSLHNLYARKEYHHKEFADSWDKISEYVDNNSDAKDMIVFNGLAFGYYMEKINPLKSIHSMPEDEEGMRQLIREAIEGPKVERVVLVDAPLSGLRMKDFEDEIALLKDYLSGHNYRLVKQECFDRDRRASLRRKFVDRPFPDCRTTVYVYVNPLPNPPHKGEGTIERGFTQIPL
ncbi:MAG TPA: glycosyltransferase family 39 protein, partial [Candidatus Omnitrophota bacterium]|nr:glycosyltransferase family 39 protein [Candidatus Omnitrophota bacterium]